MHLKTPVQKRAAVELLPPGTYPAILYRIIELGHQPKTYAERTTSRPTLLLSYVVPSQHVLINEELLPVILHREYTFSLDSGSHLYRDVVAMRCRDFADSENGLDYDLINLLGMPMLITTVLKTSKRDHQQFAEIERILPLPEDDPLPESPLDYQVLCFSSFSWELFDSLSERLRRKIEVAPEFKKLPGRSVGKPEEDIVFVGYEPQEVV